MSGYIAFPTTAPEAARWLSAHYRMEVSEQKVRRVFDKIGDGLRAGSGPNAPRLILQDVLDGIMSTLEREGYVFSADVLAATQPALSEPNDTPPVAVPCKPATIPPEVPLSKPQTVVYSQSMQPNHRGRRSRRR